MALLEVSEVEQSFRVGFLMKRATVLRGVSLGVPERSIFGFIGANGAGKTTLIHLIVGLRRPRRGSVRIAGIDAHLPEARARVGYLPERPYFHEHLTGDSFLRYFGALSGMSRPKLAARIPTVLASVGLPGARQLELRRFSKGMLQRIGIAQAILHDPEFLVLDEPMSGLDPLGRKEIRELILQLASEGRTVFFSTHVIPDVEAICDRVALIRKGELVGTGAMRELLVPGEARTEIAFAGLGEEAARGIPGLASARAFPEGVRALVEGSGAVNTALERLLERRAEILWVAPQRPSLESLFEKGPSR
jgi:ABC-2 type transport system ATP-binding protein